MKLLNDTFIVKYDDALRSIVIVHPDKTKVPGPVVQIRAETEAGGGGGGAHHDTPCPTQRRRPPALLFQPLLELCARSSSAPVAETMGMLW